MRRCIKGIACSGPVCIIVCLVTGLLSVHAGNETELERALAALTDIAARVTEQEHKLAQLEVQIRNIDHERESLDVQTRNAEWRLLHLRKQYAMVARATQFSRASTRGGLARLLSATTVRQAWKRVMLHRQLAKWRIDRLDAVSAHRNQLRQLRQRNASLLAEKRDLWRQTTAAQQQLQSRLDVASVLVASLSSEGAALNSLLAEKRSHALQLEQNLDHLTDRAMQAKMPDVPDDFTAMRGKLPMPLQGAWTLVGHFGRNRHPQLRYVTTENSGIDLLAHASAAHVLAVHQGQVSAIFSEDDNHSVVMLRHGRFLSVYGNLEQVSVKQGQLVSEGQILGIIHTEHATGRTVLHFELRRERDKLNPESWLDFKH